MVVFNTHQADATCGASGVFTQLWNTTGHAHAHHPVYNHHISPLCSLLMPRLTLDTFGVTTNISRQFALLMVKCQTSPCAALELETLTVSCKLSTRKEKEVRRELI